MLVVFIRRHRSMILASLFFFYLGCGITLSSLQMDCKDDGAKLNYQEENDYYGNVEYAVLILSSPNNEGKRDAIRATWAKFASNIFLDNGEKLYKWNHTWIGRTKQTQFIKFFYVIGTHGLSESKEHNLTMENARSKDLLLFSDFEDSYKNLASKMVTAMKWLNTLKHLKYVIKCDDDSFVRVDLIVRDLEAYAPHMNGPEIDQYISYKEHLPVYRGLYWGYFDGHANVYTRGKWQESSWFLCDRYLPYALGGGYIVSKSIVDYIARNSDVLRLYMAEDVSMGVWTAALDGINRVHDVRFDTQWKSRGCLSHMLVRHKQTPKDMFDMYRTLVQSHGERLCKTDTILRKSYHYKWDVLPSLCCK